MDLFSTLKNHLLLYARTNIILKSIYIISSSDDDESIQKRELKAEEAKPKSKKEKKREKAIQKILKKMMKKKKKEKKKKKKKKAGSDGANSSEGEVQELWVEKDSEYTSYIIICTFASYNNIA